MKTNNRFARPLVYVPPTRSPYQDFVAAQRRRVWLERVGMFAAGLLVLAVALGHIGA